MRVHERCTSGIRSLYLYCDGKCNELVIAALNRVGLVFPPFATTCWRTEPAPADSPQMVTFLGSPPNLLICKQKIPMSVLLEEIAVENTYMFLDPLQCELLVHWGA